MIVYLAIILCYLTATTTVVTLRVKHVQEFPKISVYHANQTNFYLILLVSIVILLA